MGGGGSLLLQWFLPISISLNPKMLLLWLFREQTHAFFFVFFYHTEGQLPHLRSPIALWNYLGG